ncbi:DUF3301 domain-containing protein [Pseudomarimonas salicorniae]|uniref:DUF3301 domain-containing protein n=1 Tax=Pseudomarimonas salicorniae TaxID=2933270 RepID=A0ABT0GDD3_9GAMM|nr:DUF3301 domain-containing protein [Lysobacter sp. CAU 1642]MCK7592563.1 DUF3301 domain-containing protein [Lysobacter sp. CAU 1642]
MTATLICLLLIGAFVLFWSAARDASEVARGHARAACQRQHVQLLDQSVALRRFRLRRNEEGRMRFERTYQFAYSAAGHDRQLGELSLLGKDLLWISEPQPGDEPT